MVTVPNLPYKSQLEPGALWANSDCGAACVWMVAKLDRLIRGLELRDDVDAMARLLARYRWGYDLSRPDQVAAARQRFATIGDLTWLAQQYRVPLFPSDYSHATTRLTIDRIRLELDQLRPVICLVLYEELTTRRNKSFKGGHYVVVKGYEADTFYLNDPYYPGDEGEGVDVPAEELAKALKPGRPNPYFSLPSGLYYRRS